MSTEISITDATKIVKAVLKKAYPAVKFSVRAKRYAGGSSIDVSWTDGPTEKMVDDLVGNYHGADFDGMTDCKDRRDTVVVTSKGFQAVQYENDYIMTSRHESLELMQQAARQVAQAVGLPVPEIKPDREITGVLAWENVTYNDRTDAYCFTIYRAARAIAC